MIWGKQVPATPKSRLPRHPVALVHNIYVCVYIHTYIHTYIHIHAYICMYMYVYIYIYIYLWSAPAPPPPPTPNTTNHPLESTTPTGSSLLLGFRVQALLASCVNLSTEDEQQKNPKIRTYCRKCVDTCVFVLVCIGMASTSSLRPSSQKTHMHIYIYIYIYMCVCICVCTYMYIHYM